MGQDRSFWKDYQDKAWSFAKDSSKSLEYLLAGLVGEPGEVAEKVKKRKRGDYSNAPDALFNNDIVLELGDCIWYPFALATHIGVNLAQAGGFVPPSREKPVPCKDLTAACVLLTKKATAIAEIFMVGDEIIAEDALPDMFGSGAISSTPAHFRFANAVKSYMEQIARIAAVADFDVYSVATRNDIKLSSRKAAGTISGSGDNR